MSTAPTILLHGRGIRGMRVALVPLSLAATACARDDRAVRGSDTATHAVTTHPSATASARDTTLWLLAPRGTNATVGSTTTERELIARFGAANVRRDDLAIGEGETEPATVLFPADSLRLLEIFWVDTVARDRPARIVARGAAWVAHPGLRIGSPLADVERLNGRPFTMTGFGWDYGGTAVRWDGGRLDSLPRGVERLLVRFDARDDAPVTDAERARVAGDREIASSNPIMQRIDPTVYWVEVRFR